MRLVSFKFGIMRLVSIQFGTMWLASIKFATRTGWSQNKVNMQTMELLKYVYTPVVTRIPTLSLNTAIKSESLSPSHTHTHTLSFRWEDRQKTTGFVFSIFISFLWFDYLFFPHNNTWQNPMWLYTKRINLAMYTTIQFQAHYANLHMQMLVTWPLSTIWQLWSWRWCMESMEMDGNHRQILSTPIFELQHLLNILISHFLFWQNLCLFSGLPLAHFQLQENTDTEHKCKLGSKYMNMPYVLSYLK